MNAFDFDNTLYHGESAVDFALFLIRYNKRIILLLPRIFRNLLKYKLCLAKKDQIQEELNHYLPAVLPDKPELDRVVRQFWSLHQHRLDKRLIRRIRPEDAIISACPDFLIRPLMNRLHTSTLICTEVDTEQKQVIFLNFSSQKVIRFRERYGERNIHAFFTDSFNDKAMMDISERVYLVKKGAVRRIK